MLKIDCRLIFALYSASTVGYVSFLLMPLADCARQEIRWLASCSAGHRFWGTSEFFLWFSTDPTLSCRIRTRKFSAKIAIPEVISLLLQLLQLLAVIQPISSLQQDTLRFKVIVWSLSPNLDHIRNVINDLTLRKMDQSSARRWQSNSVKLLTASSFCWLELP